MASEEPGARGKLSAGYPFGTRADVCVKNHDLGMRTLPTPIKHNQLYPEPTGMVETPARDDQTYKESRGETLKGGDNVIKRLTRGDSSGYDPLHFLHLGLGLGLTPPYSRSCTLHASGPRAQFPRPRGSHYVIVPRGFYLRHRIS
jgi:hypothetical protein